MITDPFLSDRISNGGNVGPDGRSIYVIFLGSTSSTATDSFNLSLRYDGSNNFFISNTATGWRLNGTAAAVATLSLNTPTLFVVRFDFSLGATDTVNLWINPALGQALGTPNVVLSGIHFPGLGNFQTRASVANAMMLDELRVGTSLAALTPFTAPPPSAPSTLSASAVSTSQINLTWNDNSTDETGFEIERSANGSAGWVQIATPADNALSSSDTGLSAATLYHYRIRATSAAGDSAYSNIANATTLDGVHSFRVANGLAANGSEDLLTPAGDGVANLLKFAFNMLGTGTGQSSTFAVPNKGVLSATGHVGLPLQTTIGGRMQVTYVRRKASTSPGITYVVEFTSGLDTWEANASTEEVSNIDADFERVTVTDSLVNPTTRFDRVRVSAP